MFTRRRTKSAADQQRAAEEFWTWWRAGGADSTAAALAAGDSSAAADELGRRVGAIHPGLAWELGPGRTSAHLLVISSEGNPDLRAIAARWRRGAPEPDLTWDYADSRQPVANLDSVVLAINAHQIPASAATVGARVQASHVDVGLHHPVFTEMSEQERRIATFLLLDAALGELAVEAWLGEISAQVHPLPDAIPLTFLQGVVQEVSEGAFDENGEPTWVIGRGTDDKGHEVHAVAQVPLTSSLWPHLDTYVAVQVPYRNRAENGWPDDDSLDALRRFETHLVERVKGSGRLVAHTSADGVRTLHFYVDGATPAVEQMRAAVGGWDQGDVRVETLKDAGWSRVAHLRM